MYKLIRSKKAIAVDDFIPLLLTIFIFIFAIFFSSLLISSGEKEKAAEIDISTEKIDSQDILFNYLRIGENSERIIYHCQNGDPEELYPFLKEYFDPIFFISGSNSWKTWVIKIKQMPEDILLLEESGSIGINQGGLSRALLAEAVLPLPEQNRYLKIELFKYGRGTAIGPID